MYIKTELRQRATLNSNVECEFQVIEFMIDVAKECCEIGNFNSLMAIVAGLSLPAVTRLKRTVSHFACKRRDLNKFQKVLVGYV